MDSWESILAIILSFFLVIPVVAASQYLRLKFKSLSDIDEDLRIEVNALTILDREHEIKNMLDKLIKFLNSDEVKWVSIELSSEKHGRITIRNEEVSIESLEQVRYVKVLKIVGEDVLYLTIGIRND
ncbi:MAG: hypothetical protein FGF52_00130 [Candidatus Brockarchaeota archaeon]|nr:hypothetical protein [Candidatus Brockarchaeota archaeon]